MIIQELDKIREAEEAYQNRMPTNLIDSAAYDSADDCISIISDAIVSLMDAFYQ